jgi:hypothetical protein
MKRRGVEREGACGVVQHEGRANAERRARAFDCGDQQAIGRRLGARMNGEDLDCSEAGAESDENLAKRFRPMDHHETTPRRQERDRGADPCRKIGSPFARWMGQDMRARASRRRRGPHPRGREERRIHRDKIGLAVFKIAGSARSRRGRVGDDHAHALAKAVRRRISPGEIGKLRIDFDEIDPRRRKSQCDCQSDGADPGADIGDATGRGRRGGKERCVRAGAMSLRRLHQF